jgi:hypothetical protein
MHRKEFKSDRHVERCHVVSACVTVHYLSLIGGTGMIFKEEKVSKINKILFYLVLLINFPYVFWILISSDFGDGGLTIYIISHVGAPLMPLCPPISYVES